MKYLTYSLCLLLAFGAQVLTAQEEEYGLASYYSDDFQGRSTAYGDTYDKDQLTCAHKRYPHGTMLRVTRLDTKKSVNVKVTDKGPFIKGRVVDLSRRAAEILGIVGEGAVEVKVEKISASNSRVADEEPNLAESRPRSAETTVPLNEDIRSPAAAAPAPTPAPQTRPARPAVETMPAPSNSNTDQVAESRPARNETRVTEPEVRNKPNRNALVGDDYATYGLYKMVLEKPGNNANFGVQVASFSNYENVLQKVADLQAKWFDNILISIEPGTNGTNAYKVILGPFADQKTAQHYQESLRSRYNIKGFVLDLSSLNH